MALLIPAHGDARTVVPRNGRAFELSELQAFVGGYIEAVAVPDGRIMFVNEDGKRERLPINEAATLLVIAWIRPDDLIVGDAVVCTRIEAGAGEELE